MALLNAGYWQTTYWAENYWNPRYWPQYGAPTPTPIPTHVGRYRPRKKLSHELKIVLAEWLQVKLGD